MLAGLAFDELVPLYDFENYELNPQSTVCPNGNLVVLFEQSKQGIRNTYMQIYSPGNEALLTEPVIVGPPWMSGYLIINPDNSIALVQNVAGGYGSHMLILNTYSQAGNLLSELSNIQVLLTQRTILSIRPVSDGLGGLHFCIREENGPYRYQHIDALGNLAHPVQGLNIEGIIDNGWGMITTEDHGALLSIPVRVNYIKSVKFVKIGADHQIAGEFANPSLEGIPDRLFLMGADLNSFYAAWRTISAPASFVSASRMSYAGECLWVVDCASDSSTANILDAIIVNSGGNLIVHYDVVQAFPYYRISRFDVIDPLGSVIHSQLTNLHDPNFSYYSGYKYTVADNEGGWFLVCVSNEPFVQHFNSDFTSWPSALPLTGGVLSFGAVYINMQLHEGNLHFLYQIDQDDQNSIHSQIIDNQGNATYPVPGILLLTGMSGSASDLRAFTLPGGLCLTMWRQGRNSQQKLMYNIISPSGISLFPTAQCFLEESAYLNYECLPISDTQVLIVWTRKSGDDYISRAQVLDRSGNIAWEPEGRLLYSGPGDPIFSMHNGALYMARSTGTQIMLHRYVNGAPSWEENGILAGIQNPDWLSNSLWLEALSGNRIFWSQGPLSFRPEMSFMNIIDDTGNLQYSATGLPLGDLGSEYVGLRPSHYFWQDETQIYVLAYIYRVLEHDDGPSSPSSWHYYSDHKIQSINADGSLGAAPSLEQNVYSTMNCFLGDAYYVERRGPAHSGILKYDLLGNQLWSTTLSHDSFLKDMCPLPDGRILLMSSGNYQCFYFLLDPSGSIEIPADALWGTGNIPNLYPTDHGAYLYPTDYGAYMILVPGGGHYGAVQYYAAYPINNDDPHGSPPVQLISQNFPNPFQEQTRICLKLDEAAPATLKVYNIRGQIVKTLCNTDMPKGSSYLDWDGKDEKGKACASGVYILRAQADRKSKTIKILKIR